MSNSEISRRKFLVLGGATSALAGLHISPAVAAESLPKVPRKVLGKTGQQIPILLLGGAVPLDPRFDPKIAEAVRFGVDYIDAADCYGGTTCEAAVGSYHTLAKNRKDLWITSKSDAHDPAGFESTLDTSIKRLKSPYIDMYYLHAVKSADPFTPELQKLVERKKKEGVIKYFGFSCHDGGVPELLKKAASLGYIDSVMFRYNFRTYGDKELNAAMDVAHKAGVGLIAMKTQGSESSFRDSWKKFEQKGKWNKFQAVLKAVWADERITAAVSHMDTLDKLKQNVAAALDKSKLTQLETDALEKYAQSTRHLACDGCEQFCGAAAAGSGVSVGTTLRYLMYHDVYGDAEEAKRRFAALPAEARNLDRLDAKAATAACPHGVDVTALMHRAQEVFIG